MNASEEQRVFLLLLDEIDEALSDFERRCLLLERSSSQADLKVIFRAAHNIKGGSRLFGLNELGHFAHCVEDLLNTLTTRAAAVDSTSIDLLLKAHSVISEWTRALRQDRKAVLDTTELRSQIQTHSEKLKASPPPSSKAPEAPEVEDRPELDARAEVREASQSETPAVSVVAETGSRGHRFGGQSGWKKRSQKRARTGTLRIPSQKVDEIMQMIGELSIQQSIIWHGQLTHTLDSSLCRNAIALNQKVIKDMHNLVLSLRMQPVESLFQRIERTARDIARDLNKKIQVKLVGSDVLLDKTVIELMIDPMMHLIRNAVDHGIEQEETRTRLGKPVPARIKIEANQDAGHVVISVSDDGAGIDPQRVRQKAMEKGLISQNLKLSDEEAVQLIFMPGFSTRDQVTEISGRGVGMDVVQQAIQQIGGSIQIQSRPGQGTSFEVLLPTSLEVIDGLVIRVDGNTYIAPMLDVVEIVDLDAFKLERMGQGGWAIQLRDAMVPVESLCDYIGDDPKKLGSITREQRDLSPMEVSPAVIPGASSGAVRESKNVALIVRLQNRSRLALKVDKVIAQQQIVVRPLSDQLASVPGFTGATILGNGEPGLILSLNFIGECYLNWIAQTRRSA